MDSRLRSGREHSGPDAAGAPRLPQAPAEDEAAGMAEIALASATQRQLARLARMPADSEAALERLRCQIESAWSLVSGLGAPALFAKAIATATPVLPRLQHPHPHVLDELLDDLEQALLERHAAEIRVVSFTLLSGLLEAVQEEHGAPVAGWLLAGLEDVPS